MFTRLALWPSVALMVAGAAAHSTEADVRKARAAVNYSEWTTTAGRRKGTAMGLLAAACEDVRTGRMPPVQYRMIHPEANLRNEDIDSLCTWSRTAMKQLRSTRTIAQIPVHTGY